MTQSAQTRVMLVDDHEIMRDGLREVLERSGDFDVVGQAGNGDAAVRVAHEPQTRRDNYGCNDAAQERDRGVPGDH